MYTAEEAHVGGVGIIVNKAGVVEHIPLWEYNTGIWIVDGIQDQVQSMGAMVIVDHVVDAFRLLIEDDLCNGDIARITPQYGVSVVGMSQ
ncbi:hypothetical protein BGZ93_002428 [Podila epicladia]|nr:hypothetical protein BGZ92_005500 [Podila epicladia]KAG0097590.1 hypothetical protein BGZ93_002428 [Podila epicladia]